MPALRSCGVLGFACCILCAQDGTPQDTRFITLPGSNDRASAFSPREPSPPPAAPPEGAQPKPGSETPPPPHKPTPSPASRESRPAKEAASAPKYPAEFQADSAAFLHKRVGQWTIPDARAMLGPPLRARPALSDQQKPNGQILAFADPTRRYQELELDFDARGALRTVFVYPAGLTWEQCRERWGTKVTSAQAKKGRTFYSYLDQRLDVLVAPDGKVISLGLY